MPVFILDSNFFIEAHRATYPIDVAHGFWTKVHQLALEGKVISIDKVRKEIFSHEDELKQWCNAHLPMDFFKSSKSVMSCYGTVVAWADSKRSHYLPNAIAEFLDADQADAHLVAYALSDPADLIITTQEVSQPARKNKIKIPDACIDLGVRYCNTIEMFRQLGETF